MSRKDDLACREVAGLLSELLDGQLRDGPRRAVEAHLLGCGNCARYLKQLREAVARTQALGTSQPHEELDVGALLADLSRHLRIGRGSG